MRIPKPPILPQSNYLRLKTRLLLQPGFSIFGLIRGILQETSFGSGK